MKITNKNELVEMLQEVVNCSDLTVQEMTSDTQSVIEATLQALTLVEKAHYKNKALATVFHKYSDNFKMNFDEVYDMEMKIQKNLQTNSISNTKQQIDIFLNILCFSFERNYNGSPVHQTISHYERMKNRIA